MGIMSALKRMALTFHLIREEGENTVRSIGETAGKDINDALLGVHR
jgi:hypothetical protein